MGFLNDIWNGVKKVATVASPFIPGAQWVGPAIAGIDAMTSGAAAERGQQRNMNAAEAAANQQRQMLATIMPHLMKELESDPYAVSGQSDPYSATNSAVAAGVVRDAATRNLNNAITASEFYLPNTGVNSSYQQARTQKMIRDAAQETTSQEVAARLQGGIERYNNMVQGRLAKRQFAMQLPGVLGGASMQGAGLNANLANMYGQDAASQGDALAAAIQAIAPLIPNGPRGGKTGSARGDKPVEPIRQTIGVGQSTTLGGLNTKPTNPFVLPNVAGF